QRQKLNRAIRTYGPDSGGPDGGAAVSWRGGGIRVLVVAALRTASSLALAGAVMTDCAGGCPVAATASASRARSSCARARRARARLGRRARAWRYCWRASSTWPVAASKKPRLAWPIASPSYWLRNGSASLVRPAAASVSPRLVLSLTSSGASLEPDFKVRSASAHRPWR